MADILSIYSTCKINHKHADKSQTKCRCLVLLDCVAFWLHRTHYPEISITQTHTCLSCWDTHMNMINQRGQRSRESQRCLPQGKTELETERNQMLKHGTRVSAIRWNSLSLSLCLSLSLDQLSVSRQQLSVERKNLGRVVRHGMCVCECVYVWRAWWQLGT